MDKFKEAVAADLILIYNVIKNIESKQPSYHIFPPSIQSPRALYNSYRVTLYNLSDIGMCYMLGKSLEDRRIERREALLKLFLKSYNLPVTASPEQETNKLLTELKLYLNYLLALANFLGIKEGFSVTTDSKDYN